MNKLYAVPMKDGTIHYSVNANAAVNVYTTQYSYFQILLYWMFKKRYAHKRVKVVNNKIVKRIYVLPDDMIGKTIPGGITLSKYMIDDIDLYVNQLHKIRPWITNQFTSSIMLHLMNYSEFIYDINDDVVDVIRDTKNGYDAQVQPSDEQLFLMKLSAVSL